LKTIYQIKSKKLFYQLELDDRTLKRTIIDHGRPDIKSWQFEAPFETEKVFRQKLNRKRRQGWHGVFRFVSDGEAENKDSKRTDTGRKSHRQDEPPRQKYVWVLGRKLTLQ